MSYQDFPPQRAPVAPSPYTLTRDEQRVLRECAQESFYRRCIPLMTAFGLGAYYGVHLGYLKPNSSYGSAPKVALGLVVGFIAGKLSYKSQCEEKILRLPGGKLKESLLMTRQTTDNLWRTFEDRGMYKDATLSYALPSYGGSSHLQEEPKSMSELHMDRPIDSFDDSFKLRSDFLDETDHALPNISPSRSVSYDELRYRNREEYENRRKQYRSGPLDDHSPYSESYPPISPSTPRAELNDRTPKSAPYQSDDPYYAPAQPRSPPQRKNYYGDIIDK